MIQITEAKELKSLIYEALEEFSQNPVSGAILHKALNYGLNQDTLNFLATY
jgi:hypothetical protein